MPTSSETPSRDFRLLLQRELLSRCRKNPAYSLRAFAKQLGVEPSALSKVLARKRRVTPKLIRRAARALGLSAEKTEAYVAAYASSGTAYHELSLDRFRVISDWYHFAILELVALADARSDARWVSDRLGIGERTADLAIRRLLRLGLLERDANGRLANVQGSHTTVGHPDSAAAFRKMHKQILRHSTRSITEVPIDRRDHSAMTVAIDSSRIGEAKARIRTFRRELSAFLQRSSRPLDEVYQLTISLFPATRAKATILAAAAILALGSVRPTSAAVYGGQESHAGGAVVCFADSARTDIRSVELYDLYEGRTYYGFASRRAPGKTADALLEEAFATVDRQIAGSHFASLLRRYVGEVRKNLVFGERLPLLPDATLRALPEGCVYRQLAVWKDSDRSVTVDRELFAKLDPLNVAATFVHEAVYFLYRDLLDSENSEEARKTTAEVAFGLPVDGRFRYAMGPTLAKVPFGIQPRRFAGTHEPTRRDTFGYDGTYEGATAFIDIVAGSPTIGWRLDRPFARYSAGETIEIPLDRANLFAFTRGESTLVDPRLWLFLYAHEPFAIRVRANRGAGKSEFRVVGKHAFDPPSLGESWEHSAEYRLDLIDRLAH